MNTGETHADSEHTSGRMQRLVRFLIIMNAEEYLNTALGGNMNISTLTPLAWREIMEGYARHVVLQSLEDDSLVVVTFNFLETHKTCVKRKKEEVVIMKKSETKQGIRDFFTDDKHGTRSSIKLISAVAV